MFCLNACTNRIMWTKYALPPNRLEWQLRNVHVHQTQNTRWTFARANLISLCLCLFSEEMLVTTACDNSPVVRVKAGRAHDSLIIRQSYNITFLTPTKWLTCSKLYPFQHVDDQHSPPHQATFTTENKIFGIYRVSKQIYATNYVLA